jgi:phospholipid/cholesterol/gamma-HCH transport system substrate-binding protein
MSARAYALMTGVFVIVLVAVIGGAAYWFGGANTANKPYVVVAHSSIIGLHEQSTVYYRGVPVGHVTGIHLAPHDIRKTRIRISIHATIPITPTTYAGLHAQGVTGLARLELNDSGKSKKRLSTSPDHPATIPLTGGAAGVTSAAQKLVDKLNNIADSLQAVVSPSNRKRINTILANTAELTGRLSKLEKQLDKGLSGLPRLTHAARRTLHRIDGLTAHLTSLTDSLKSLSGQFSGFAKTGQVAGRELARRTLPKLNKTLDDLQNTAKALENLGKSLERNPQQLLFGPTKQHPGPGESGFNQPSH